MIQGMRKIHNYKITIILDYLFLVNSTSKVVRREYLFLNVSIVFNLWMCVAGNVGNHSSQRNFMPTWSPTKGWKLCERVLILLLLLTRHPRMHQYGQSWQLQYHTYRKLGMKHYGNITPYWSISISITHYWFFLKTGQSPAKFYDCISWTSLTSLPNTFLTSCNVDLYWSSSFP